MSPRPSLEPVSSHSEERGLLRAMEFGDLPFVPRRIFTISNVPRSATRANHAPTCDEFLFMAAGSCSAKFRNMTNEPIVLAEDGPGLFLPAGTFLSLGDFSAAAAVVVFASLSFDDTDYLEL